MRVVQLLLEGGGREGGRAVRERALDGVNASLASFCFSSSCCFGRRVQEGVSETLKNCVYIHVAALGVIQTPMHAIAMVIPPPPLLPFSGLVPCGLVSIVVKVRPPSCVLVSILVCSRQFRVDRDTTTYNHYHKQRKYLL